MSFTQRARTERLICYGRVVLGLLTLAVVRLGPNLHADQSAIAYTLTLLFLVYGVAAAIMFDRLTSHLGRFQFATHVIDLIAFGVLGYLTEGPVSPFLAYFLFALVAATLRWQWRGTVWTAGIVFVSFGVMSLSGGFVWHEANVDLDHSLLLGVSLAVVVGLLTFVGLHENRLRRDVDRLALWAQDVTLSEDEGGRLADLLRHAGDVMDSRRVLMAWDDGCEPWLRLAYLEDGRVTFSRTAPAEFAPLVVDELVGAGFVCSDARGGAKAVTLFGHEREINRRSGTCVNPGLAERFEMSRLVSTPVELEEGEGRLFFMVERSMSADDLAFGHIVARGVAVFMAETALRERLRRSAMVEERVRLARDLHDGLLQSMTGTAIQLETARRLIEKDPGSAGEAVEAVQRSLVQEQRDLRSFVEALKPGNDPGEQPRREAAGEPISDLRTRLAELRDSVARRWGLEVEVVMSEDVGASTHIPADLFRDVAFLAHEGLVNSARHASATHIGAYVHIRGDHLMIVLADDGRGFGFSGRRDAAWLEEQGLGPVSLSRRVQARGGTMVIDSGDEGSRIEIVLPVDSVVTHVSPTGTVSQRGAT